MTDIGGQISMEWRKELFLLRNKMQKAHFAGSAEEYFRHYKDDAFVQDPKNLRDAFEELNLLRSFFPTKEDTGIESDTLHIPLNEMPKSRPKDFAQSPNRFKH